MTLFIHDGVPSGSTTGGTREAWAVGWEYLLGYTSSFSPTCGTGYGQFPLGSQTFTNVSVGGVSGGSGSLWWRKSATADITPRSWIAFVDVYTMHLFVATGDTAGVYSYYHFGDIFSLRLIPDNYKCLLRGRCANAAGSTARFDLGDFVSRANTTNFVFNDFMPRTAGGGGSSIVVAKLGDMGKGSPFTATTPSGTGEVGMEMGGVIPFINPTDQTIYVSPIWIAETSNSSLRGRLRGIYHPSHATGNFTDGQVFAGTGEYAGKTFQVVKGGYNNGTWLLEISPTVETN
jgi:hypothetical protein